MIFKAKILSESFKCSLGGTGNVKIIVNDKFITSLSLPKEINICSEECNNDSDVYKIQIEDIDSKEVKIGPVTDGEILEIESWGDLDIIQLNNLFERNNNEIIKLPDYIPKSLTNLSHLFYGTGACRIEGIESWDVSAVTDMSHMFQDAKNFNQDISSWNVSSVTDMGSMFSGANNFNQNLASWDVSNVRNMSFMFCGTNNFDGDISKWDVSSVTDMSFMFCGAKSFNGDISSWNVSSVTNMMYMFCYAKSFNQNISKWNVSSVMNMMYMFFRAENFDQDISSWDVSSLKLINCMFKDARSFNFNIPNIVDIILRNIESSEDLNV